MPSFSQILSQSVTDSGVKATVVYATAGDLPLTGNEAGDIGLVSENNRLYIFTGTGWYNVALINTNPTIITGPAGSYSLASDGTPIVITLVAQDPEEVPIAWSYAVTSGSLGSTATVSQAENVFTITPSTDAADVGSFSITFTASDGVNLSTATSSFTLSFGVADTNYNNSILIATSSTDGENNNTFEDSSTNNFTITRNGNSTQGSFSPYSPAGWGTYLDGTGDYLSIAQDGSAFEFSNGDFTLEAWVNLDDNSDATGRKALFGGDANGGFDVQLLTPTNQISVGRANISYEFSTTYIFTPGVWTHVAISRASGTIRCFVDGVLLNSASNSTSYGAGSLPVYVGSSDGGNHRLAGHVSDLRVVKGTAVYTEDFTPPEEPLTAITGTSLLVCQSNRFIDNSSNGFVVSPVGDAKVTPFSPYLPQVEYNPATHSGSAYFDGTGDYLDIPSSTAFGYGTGDFTIEFWAYFTSISGSVPNLLDQRSGGHAIVPTIYLGGGSLNYYVNAGLRIDGPTVQANQWYHIALCRSTGLTKMFANGVLQGSFSDSFDYITSPVRVFASADGAVSAQAGYCSDLRIIKGTAVYTEDFTPPTEPLTAITNTSLLMNFANAGVYDETGKIFIDTLGATDTSTAVTKYRDTSIYFSGVGGEDAALLNAENFLNFRTGDFTVEAWSYLISAANGYKVILKAPHTSGLEFFIRYGDSGLGYKLAVGTDDAFSEQHACQFTQTDHLNQWVHIAYTRSAGVCRLFVNGNLTNTGTGINPSSYPDSSWTDTRDIASVTGPRIGSGYTSVNYNGYISDLRITKGVARYTASFTPPTQALGFNNAE